MKLLFIIVGALLLIIVGIYIVAILPYSIYLKKNKELLAKKGISTVSQLQEFLKKGKLKK